MANQRHPDQRLIAFALDKELLGLIDSARDVRDLSRSKYVREAVVEKLQGMGISVPEVLRDAPDRAGKVHKKPIVVSYGKAKKASSEKVSAAQAAAMKAAKAERNRGAK